MAFALQLDGVNDYLSFPAWSASGDFTISDTFLTGNLSSTMIVIGNDSNTGNYLASYANGNLEFRLGSTTPSPLLGGLVANTEYNYTITRVGTLVTVVVDSLGSVSFNQSATAVFNAFGRFSPGSYFDGQYRGITVFDNGTDVRNYDVNSSSTGAGPVILTDTIGGLNAIGVNTPTDGSAWINLGGSGITVTVTESRSQRVDLSNLLIAGTLSISTTETRSSRVDTSSLSINGNVIATVTEVRSARKNSSTLVVEDLPLTAIVTEVKSSRVDLSFTSIEKDILAIVTEIRSARVNLSSVDVPVTIIINPRNKISVRRKINTLSVQRKNNIIKAKS